MSIPEHRWSRTCALPCRPHWLHPASLRRPRDSADRRRSSARRGLQGLRGHCWTCTSKPQTPCDRPATLVVPSAPAWAPFCHQLPTRSDRHQAAAEPQSSDPLAGSAIHPALKETFYFSNLNQRQVGPGWNDMLNLLAGDRKSIGSNVSRNGQERFHRSLSHPKRFRVRLVVVPTELYGVRIPNKYSVKNFASIRWMLHS